MGVNVEFTGVSDLVDELDRWVGNSDKVIDATLKAAAEPVLKEAKTTTTFHDHTGKLRKTLKISGVKKKGSGKYVLVGTSDAFYGRFIEYGTSKMTARPFLAPAFEHNQNAITDIIKNKLSEALGE